MENKFNHKVCEETSQLHNIQLKINNKSLEANNDLFSIIMPPPNLTGVLHIGHAWNGTVQDFLIRYQILKKKNAIWFVGTDHAGIATQTKYENFLKNEKKHEILLKSSRSEKIFMLNNWAKKNNEIILSQWKKMGFFLDYENERFTLDSDANKLVNETFVNFYKKGLIYKGNKLINWDVKLKTAISNIEVIKKNISQKMYYIKYFLENKKDYLIVATTRPETIFVDSAVFINPNDNRYKHCVNKKVINPLTQTAIPIIFDNYVDKEFGTGVMKCTPAHDFNDYELGKKYCLPTVSCIDYDGKMNKNAHDFNDIDRFDCRKKVVIFLKEKNLLLDEKDIVSNVGFSERSDEVVEPMLSEQWFIKMKPLAKKIIDIQSSKNKINFYPKKFEKNLINWLVNIDDWCISRQLWWGHQIPAWYHKNSNEIYVDIKPPQDIENWKQDNDVLDTWFSSGLWPLVVTQNNNEKFFPTDVLVTAYDIIFFWVVRMISFSLEIKNQIPFKDVLITGLIRDEHGRKMSKSLGNGIDPNQIADEKGVDTLRLILLSSSSPGEDIKFSTSKLDSSWMFLNKLWNSFRYIINFKNLYNDLKDDYELEFVDLWIINKFFKEYKSIIGNFNKYNILVGVNKIVNFVKNDYCNTYIEINKQRINSKCKILIFTLFYLMKNILILLHPVCPYITEYLYNLLPNKKKQSIIEETINLVNITNRRENITADILEIIEYIRKIRFNNKIPKKDAICIEIFYKKTNLYENNKEKIVDLLMTENIILNNIFFNELVDNKQIVLTNLSIKIITQINNSNKISDLLKDIELTRFEINRANKLLTNENFLKKAKLEKINLEKEKKLKYETKLIELEKILEKFSKN